MSFNGTSISLEQALERALRSNPELAAVGRETEIASGARQQAGLIPNPDLSWSVEDTRQGNRQTSVSIAQPLELGGKRGARVEVAKRGSEIAWTQLEVRRAELRAQVRGAYYAALTAQEQVRLAKTSWTWPGARCRPPTDGSRPAASPRWNGFAPRSWRTTPSST